MRTVNATLQAALAAGSGHPFAKAYIGLTDGTVLHSGPALAYKLTGHTLEFETAYTGDVAGSQTAIWLERGLTINGTDYTITTGRFRLLSQHYLPNGRQVAKGSLFPIQYYTASAYDTYQNVITAFCTAYGKTAVFRDPAAAWLNYKFFPAGKALILNDANRFAYLLAQKYLIYFCDNGSEEVLFYSCDGSLIIQDISLSPVNDFAKDKSTQHNRCLIWRDENETVTTAGSATDPLHNLGYLESTALPPARRTVPNLFQARTRPDLRIVDGDIVSIAAFGGEHHGFALVTEEFISAGKGHEPPRWQTIIDANPCFENTAGGAMPSTIERISNYTPLNTGTFNHLLSTKDNNLQAAMETIDDHALSTFSNIWGANALRQAVPGASSNYMAPFVDGLLPTQTASVNFPKAATVKNLYVRIESAQPASGSLVVTLMIAGAATAVQVTIPAGSAVGNYSDTTHTATLNASNAVSFRLTNNAPAGQASAQVNGISVELAGLT